jgi:hypothetical protein
MYILKELETSPVYHKDRAALNVVELGNNQWQTLLQISLVLLLN